MKAPDPSEKHSDWREQLHHLPRGERSFPAWVRWLIYAPVLFMAGCGVILLGGAPLALSLGSRPEDSGGAVWGMLGMMMAMVFGGIIAWICHWRGHSRATCRAIFYIFISPAWILMIFAAWQTIEYHWLH